MTNRDQSKGSWYPLFILDLAGLFPRILIIALMASALAAVNTSQVLAAERLRIVAAKTVADTGMVRFLTEGFRVNHPDVDIDIQQVGALATLDLGRRGIADLIITHYPEGEKLFVADGYGLLRTNIMYNEFTILGPPNDPLKLAQEKDLPMVLQRLAHTWMPKADGA